MERVKNTKRKTFGRQYIRYMLSYMLILMIPLAVLTFFYSSRFMKRFYQEIYETVDSELVQLEIQLENEWISMENIVEQLSLNGTIRNMRTAETPLELEPVIGGLSGFCSANPFIEDIALLIEEQEYVVTSYSTVEKEYYLNRIFQLPEADEEEKDRLFSSMTPVCLPSQPVINRSLGTGEEDTVLFSFPLFTDFQKRNGTVLFFVHDSAIQKLMNQKLQSYQAQLYIRDQNGTVIVAAGPFQDAVYEDASQYIIRSHTSPENQWSYEAYLPNRQDTFSQVSSIMREFLLAILLTLLLASFAIYILSKVNYNPVRKLMDTARNLLPDGTFPDEMTTISHALDYLSEQNSTLSSQLSGSLSAIKNERLRRLFNGKYATRQDFNLDCSELDLYLPGGNFVIGIVMLHGEVQDAEALAKEIKKNFPVPYVYYYLHTFHPNQIVLLTHVPEMESPGELFQAVQNNLVQSYRLLSTIGIGSMTDNTECFAQSYMEASSALDYRFIKGNGTIIQFQEILSTLQTAVVYPHEEFNALRNALTSRNEQRIQFSIQTIITFMEDNPMPLYLSRSICFDLIHLVNSYFQGSESGAGSTPMELSGIETAQEIIQMLRFWSEELNMGTLQETKTAVIDEIIAYIDANCLNCDFSAYETAAHFDMTLPAFSKFFKEATGQNVMDYTIYTRIEKAKELLISTSLPLKDISEQVGYYNVSSFTRRFKLNQGCTPGEYRRMSSPDV